MTPLEPLGPELARPHRPHGAKAKSAAAAEVHETMKNLLPGLGVPHAPRG